MMVDPAPRLPLLPTATQSSESEQEMLVTSTALAGGLWSDHVDEQVRARAAGLCAELRGAVFDAPDPSPLLLFDYVFSQRTKELDRQADFMAAELERLES